VAQGVLQPKQQHTRERIKPPLNFYKLLQGPNREEWIASRDAETESLMKNSVERVDERELDGMAEDSFELLNCIPLPQEKYNMESRKIDKKLRIVADGSKQKHIGEVFTCSPTPSACALRTVCALAAQHGLPLWQTDVKRAFLSTQGNQIANRRRTYLRPPKGFDKPGVLWKVVNSVYGLVQAPREYFEFMRKLLLEFGMTQSETEPCLWSDLRNDLPAFMAVVVDDHLMAADERWYRKLLQFLRSKNLEVKDMGRAKKYVGMEVHQSVDNFKVTLTQREYILKVATDFRMDKCATKPTPLSPSKPEGGEDHPCNEEQHTEYRRLLGELNWIQVYTRPDISFACSYLAKFMAAPLFKHYVELKRMLRYLVGTADRGIEFGGSFRPPDKIEPNTLWGYSDASFAMDPGRKSTMGIVLMLNGGPVSWTSKTMPIVTISTAEAELVAASRATQDIMYLRNVFRDLGIPIHGPTTLFSDNQAMIAFSETDSQPSRMKHIDLRRYFVRDYVMRGHICLQYIPTDENCSDMLTKALSRPIFERHRNVVVRHGNVGPVTILPGRVTRDKRDVRILGRTDPEVYGDIDSAVAATPATLGKEKKTCSRNVYEVDERFGNTTRKR